ncbi:unnamed protein product [Withania somnifera]
MEGASIPRAKETTKPVLPPINQESSLASVATPNDVVAPPPHGNTNTAPQETDISSNKVSKESRERDIALSQLENEKRSSFIKAWEDSKKSKDQLEHKKAEYAEKIKNEVALIHKEADEKRAVVEARRGEELLKAEETAAKYRATGQTPKKQLLGCCGC